jgi:5'-deoxynucleotidase YfbR-like HD superfamily hydrolase
MREGGGVKRHHTYKMVGEDTVGNHTFNMLNLLLVFQPDASSNLIKAVLWHDIAERFVGDTPSPVKKNFPAIKEALRQAEEVVNERLGIKVELTPEEDSWLHGVDKLEYFIWLSEQPKTPTIDGKIKTTFERITSDASLPQEIRDFTATYKPQALDETLQQEGATR